MTENLEKNKDTKIQENVLINENKPIRVSVIKEIKRQAVINLPINTSGSSEDDLKDSAEKFKKISLGKRGSNEILQSDNGSFYNYLCKPNLAFNDPLKYLPINPPPSIPRFQYRHLCHRKTEKSFKIPSRPTNIKSDFSSDGTPFKSSFTIRLKNSLYYNPENEYSKFYIGNKRNKKYKRHKDLTGCLQTTKTYRKVYDKMSKAMENGN